MIIKILQIDKYRNSCNSYSPYKTHSIGIGSFMTVTRGQKDGEITSFHGVELTNLESDIVVVSSVDGRVEDGVTTAYGRCGTCTGKAFGRSSGPCTRS